MSRSQQSPIDLSNPVVTDFGKNKLAIKWKKTAKGAIKPDEHGVHIEFEPDERQFIKLDQKQFQLVQFHFHHPSEHWVAGVQQTMELHIVHQNKDDKSRAVIGVFIEPSTKSKVVPTLIPQLRSFLDPQDDNSDPVVSTKPFDWLPEDVKHYYRYEGSLTTPKYDENVSWVVLREPLKLSKKELMKLIPFLQHPAREAQPLNRRFVLSNFKP
ncbi:MAG: carbonic anhydrase family protein [Planctomycetaceae bacterium]